MDNPKRLAIFALALSLICAPHAARADLDVKWIPPSAPAEPDHFRALDRGERLRKHGQAATVLAILQLGVGLGLGVSLLVEDAHCKQTQCGDGAYGFSMLIGSAVMTASGAISASAGIPMWVYGAREERGVRKSLQLSASGLRLTF